MFQIFVTKNKRRVVKFVKIPSFLLHNLYTCPFFTFVFYLIKKGMPDGTPFYDGYL